MLVSGLLSVCEAVAVTWSWLKTAVVGLVVRLVVRLVSCSVRLWVVLFFCSKDVFTSLSSASRSLFCSFKLSILNTRFFIVS